MFLAESSSLARKAHGAKVGNALHPHANRSAILKRNRLATDFLFKRLIDRRQHERDALVLRQLHRLQRAEDAVFEDCLDLFAEHRLPPRRATTPHVLYEANGRPRRPGRVSGNGGNNVRKRATDNRGGGGALGERVLPNSLRRVATDVMLTAGTSDRDRRVCHNKF